MEADARFKSSSQPLLSRGSNPYHSHYCPSAFINIASEATPLATPESLEATLGMSASAVARRWLLVQQTQALQTLPLQPQYRFAQGVPDFQFPSYNSWVRFNFDSVNNASQQLWSRGRIPLDTCGKPGRLCAFKPQTPGYSCHRHRQHANG